MSGQPNRPEDPYPPSGRFRYLTGSLLILFLLPTILQLLGIEGRLVSLLATITFLVVLIGAVPAIGLTRPRVIAIACVGVVAVFLQLIVEIGRVEHAFVAYQVIMMGFLAYVVALTLRFLFTETRPTSNSIHAATSVYLLLGVIWAFAYSLLDTLEPGSFRSSLFAEGGDFMRLGSGDHSFPLYYSLVTLTTLGYGDVIPANKAAGTLASLEAVAGQLYLTVLVARLVGLNIAQQSESASSRD